MRLSSILVQQCLGGGWEDKVCVFYDFLVVTNVSFKEMLVYNLTLSKESKVCLSSIDISLVKLTVLSYSSACGCTPVQS